MLENKQIKAYITLLAFIICGLAASTVTATKIINIGINVPFSNIIFSVFTYPLIDCICELWGKQLAKQTVWIALGSQIVVVALLQLSIVMPPAVFWQNQKPYEIILATSRLVVLSSVLAFASSQILDIVIYQKIKNASEGKLLWFRSNVSTWIGQIVDFAIFVSIVFSGSSYMFDILLGSIILKIIISVLMTPVVYTIVIGLDRYLDSATLAFKIKRDVSQRLLL